MSLNIAVDLGRSSVKVMGNEGSFSFPFLVANKKNEFADFIFMDAENLQWAFYNKKEIIFGETARMTGEVLFQNTEGKFFHESAMDLTVIAVAWYLKKYKNSDSVNLGINLTFDNMFMKPDYTAFFKKKHTVRFYDKTESTFEITKVAVFYQGFAGLLSEAMDKSLKIKTDFYKSSGIVIDMGRLTQNFLFIENMMPKDGKTFDYGTYKFYDHLIEDLKKKFNVIKSYFEIEDLIKNKKMIPSLEGDDIDIFPLLEDVANKYYPDMLNLFRQFVGKYTPEYLFMLGGGAYYVGELFKGKFPRMIVADRPEWKNVEGMLKFLNRTLPEGV